jgi:plastocyanin
LSHRSKAAFAAAVAVLAVAPAGASAATKTVDMGTPISSQKTFQKAFADVNDFFPNGATIHVGDSVKFVPTGFHSVDIPAKGGKPLGLLSPAGTTSGVLDAASSPFWFNGQPMLGFTPALGPPGLFGKKLTYTGAKRIESGLPLAQHPKPFTVKFSKAGSYTYYCNVHAGMKGTVKVVGKSHSVPSAKADAKALKAQVAATLKTAKSLATTAVAPGNVSVGASGKGGVELFAMLPATQTVPVGTTLKFSMSAKSFDVHTATFGPGDPENQPTSYLGQLAKHFAEDPVAPSQAAYPSEPPGTVGSLSPTLHGNGFWNSGVLDTASTTPLPNANSVTFSAPGTYDFYCMIHPFMHGTVVVQ